MLQWMEAYTKSLVRHPDQVSLTAKEGVMVVTVNLRVADEDKDLFGGRNNRLTRAMGTVLGLAGVNARRRYVLKVAD